MQVFEFHFNPEKETGYYFDSFSYNPNNIYEKKLGNLYILGSLKRAFEKKSLLQKLAKEIKDNYYRLSGHSIEKAFNKSAEKANEFLQEKKDKADVSWMGNLGFAVISIKDKNLKLTKTGDVKVFLLRGDKKIDIDSQFETKNEIDPSTDEFRNIASSKLAKNDILILTTKEVGTRFKEKNIFDALVQSIPLSEKKIRRILYKKQLNLSELKGACLILSLNENKKEHIKKIIPSPSSSRFSFERFSISGLSKIKSLLGKIKVPKLPKVKIKKPDVSLALPALPSFSVEKVDLQPVRHKKNIFLLICFCLLLLIGFYLFKQDRQKKLTAFEGELSSIKNETEKAEQLIKEDKKSQGQKVLLKTLDEISSLESEISLPEETKNNITNLEEEIKDKLAEINNLKRVEEVKEITKFNPKEFSPQNMILLEDELYLSTPFGNSIYKFNINNAQLNEISSNESIAFSSKTNKTPVFITNDKKIKTLNSESIVESGKLNFEQEIRDFTTYSGNLYFLNNKGEILKCSSLGDAEWSSFTYWFDEKEKSTAGKVLAVDKNIWILDDQNRIRKYYRGQLEETIETDIYPRIKKISEFYTNNDLDYLYLLDTDTNRILILNKDGTIEKQLQSDKFNNPIDLTITPNGAKAYLLTNELKVITIELF